MPRYIVHQTDSTLAILDTTIPLDSVEDDVVAVWMGNQVVNAEGTGWVIPDAYVQIAQNLCTRLNEYEDEVARLKRYPK